MEIKKTNTKEKHYQSANPKKVPSSDGFRDKFLQPSKEHTTI